jgi:predicted permease
MPTYGQLLLLILPVFALVAVGVVLRRRHWVEGPAEASLLRLVVAVCYPCLIFDTVVGNAAMRAPGNVWLPPLAGFVLTVAGVAVALQAGRWLGLTDATGLRSFALTAGIGNFGYIPLPIIGSIWGRETQGVLLVHNVGVEAAMWTFGVLVLTGLSPRAGWRKLINPVTITLVVAVAANLTGIGAHVPEAVMEVVRSLGRCAIPLGLIMIGVTMANYLDDPRALYAPRITWGSAALRLALLPLVILAAARWFPGSLELKRVLVIEAAMPSAVFPIVLTRLHGGSPRIAVQVVLGTTILGVLAIPLWIRLGLAWVGL